MPLILIVFFNVPEMIKIKHTERATWIEAIQYAFLAEHEVNIKEDKKTLKKYKELLSCRPEHRLSQGELYALAMQDYWLHHMDSNWWGDEKYAYRHPEEGKYKPEDKLCRDSSWNRKLFQNSDNCYPRIIKEYNTLERLHQHAIDLEKSNKESSLISDVLEGNPIYRPESDEYLYPP